MDNRITLNHLVYQVLEFASSGTLPNEMNITYELAHQLIDEQRSIIIGRSLNKKDMINDGWIQYIPCVDLEIVDSSECCEENNGCLILKSKQKLPDNVDTFLDNWIISVNTIGGEQISKSNPIKQRYSKYNKYTKNSKIWWLKNDYLYIKNNIFLEKVSVSGLFEHPLDISRFTCSGQPCMNEDSDYPVSLTMASEIIDIIIKTKLSPFILAPADSSNNSNSNTPKQISDQKQAGS